MPHLHVLAASAGQGASGPMNHYLEEFAAAATARQSTLRELWVAGFLPFEFLRATSQVPILSLPSFFDCHPHLRFIHLSLTADGLLPDGCTSQLVACPTAPVVTDSSVRRIQMLLPAGQHVSYSVHARYTRDM